MDEIKQYTLQLSAALRRSDAYQALREADKKIKEKPELRKRVDAFRRQNYLLQNTENYDDLFADMQILENEYADIYKNSLIQEYLEAELQMCRTIRWCADEILTAVDLEIENFADVIEIG